VNDGRFHTVELVTFNRMVNLSVDGGEPVSLDSRARRRPAAGDAPLYVGGKQRVKHLRLRIGSRGNRPSPPGMPEAAMDAAPGSSSSPILNGSSFHGCIRNLYINHELQDFTRGRMEPGVEPGCRACRELHCRHGVCQPNAAQVSYPHGLLYNQRSRPLVVRRDNAALTHEE